MEIHESGKCLFFHEREIFYVKLGLNVGIEQDGKGDDYERPVLILKKYNKHCCLIVPLSTKGKKNKYYFSFNFIKNKKSYAIISQIRLIDAKRLVNKIGVISEKDFYALKKTMKDMIFNE